jgi:hypothetical protein
MMGEERKVMLVSGLFLGFVLGIVFGETMELWLDFIYRSTRGGELMAFTPPESRGDAVAAEQKDE